MKQIAWITGAGKLSGARFVAPFFLSALRTAARACCDEVVASDAPAMGEGVHLVLDASMPLVGREDMERLIEAAKECGGTAIAKGGGACPRCVAGPSGEVREVSMAKDALSTVSTPMGAAQALAALRRQKCEALLALGVWLVDPAQTYLDPDVQIGPGTVVHPGCTISGGSVIGGDCTLLPNSRIHASRIGDRTTVENAVITDCEVGSDTTVGPFAYLRNGVTVGDRCRIGCFVELKNSAIGNETKISHLTYVGDSDLGEDVNLGCGVVFVNYDGKTKHRSSVGDRAFIGCNVNLISPVRIGPEAYVAAGSTITDEVPGGAFAIARERQTTKPGWVEERKKKGKL